MARRERDRDGGSWVLGALLSIGGLLTGFVLIAGPDRPPEAAVVGALPTVEAAPVALPEADPVATPEPTAAPRTAAVTITIEAAAVTLRGQVGDPTTAEQLRRAASSVYGTAAVDDGLDVADDVVVDEASTVTLTGTVPDVETASALLDAVGGLDMGVVDELAVAPPAAAGTVAALITEDDRLEEFAALVRRSELVELLEGDGPFTVLVPRDATLVNLDDATLDVLAAPDDVVEVVRLHIIDGSYTTADLAVGDVVTTIDGTDLEVTEGPDAGSLRIGGSLILDDDRVGVNGAVLVTNRLLLPPDLANQVRLNRLVEEDPIQFTVGSADLAPESTAVLDRVAAILADQPGIDVEVQGHTDGDGPEDVNQELSEERARAVVDYLVAAGIDAERLSARGFGESRPEVDPEETDADKARNRRIEFRLS